MTDRELHARWKKNRDEYESIRHSRSQASVKRKDELAAELKSIGFEWNELYNRKLRGEITDDHAIKLIYRAIKEATLTGMKVRVQHEEDRDEEEINTTEYVLAIYDGPADEWNETRFSRFATLVTKFIRESDPTAIRLHRLGPLWDTEQQIYDNSADDLYFTIGENKGKHFAVWSANIHPWDGPGEPYLGFDSGGAMRGRYRR